MEMERTLEAFRRSMTAQMQADLDHIRSEMSRLREQQETHERRLAEQGEDSCIAEARERAASLTRQSAQRSARESYQKLLRLREKLTDSVFEAARKKLMEFSASPEYAAYFARCISSLQSAVPQQDAVLYVRPDDLSLVKGEQWQGSVQSAEDIALGGARAVSLQAGVFADATLDARLLEQGSWFRAQHATLLAEGGALE